MAKVQLPTLNLENESTAKACPRCGEPVVEGFQEGHDNFAHRIRLPKPPRRIIDVDGGWGQLLLVLFAAVPAASTFLLVALLASWLTNDGHSLLFVEPTGDGARALVVILVGALLCVPATAVFMLLCAVELCLLGILLAPVGVVLPGGFVDRLRRRARRPVPFDRVDPFTCKASDQGLHATFVFAPKGDSVACRFEVHDTNRYASTTGFLLRARGALEVALALPAELRRSSPTGTHNQSA